jgi:predicted secreted Zn-dependent protease
MTPNEELHEEIMKAFDEYFRANQRWVTKQSDPSCVQVRKCLQELKRVSLKLRQLCDQQRLVVQDFRYEKFSPKQPSKRAIAMIKERNQNVLDAKKDQDN